MSATCAITYNGSTPGADSNEYVLFSTTAAAPFKRFLALSGSRRFVLDLKNSHAGTLDAYYSADGGTNWIKYSTEAIAAPAAGVTYTRDYLVEHYDDWKLVWTNGGSAQTTWVIQMALSPQRASAA